MGNVRFFVCVPVYNAAAYLGEAIESVLCQSYHHFAIILVDDGSTDGSLEICKGYAARYTDIHVLSQTNQGQYAARMTAIRKAKDLSEYCDEAAFVLFLDADDKYVPNAFEVLSDVIAGNADVDTVVYGHTVTDVDGTELKLARRFYDGIVKDQSQLMTIVLSGRYQTYNAMWSKATRIDLFSDDDISFNRDVRVGEDLVQSLSLLAKSHKTVFISDKLYQYRDNPESIDHTTKPSKRFLDFIPRLDFIFSLLESGEYTQECMAECCGLHVILLLDFLFAVFREHDLTWMKKCECISHVNDCKCLNDVLSLSRRPIRSWVIRLFCREHYLIGFLTAFVVKGWWVILRKLKQFMPV